METAAKKHGRAASLLRIFQWRRLMRCQDALGFGFSALFFFFLSQTKSRNAKRENDNCLWPPPSLPPSSLSPILRIDENLGRKPKPVAEWGGLGRFTITAGPKKDERRGGRERDNLCPFLFRFLPPFLFFPSSFAALIAP